MRCGERVGEITDRSAWFVTGTPVNDGDLSVNLLNAMFLSPFA